MNAVTIVPSVARPTTSGVVTPVPIDGGNRVDGPAQWTQSIATITVIDDKGRSKGEDAVAMPSSASFDAAYARLATLPRTFSISTGIEYAKQANKLINGGVSDFSPVAGGLEDAIAAAHARATAKFVGNTGVAHAVMQASDGAFYVTALGTARPNFAMRSTPFGSKVLDAGVVLHKIDGFATRTTVDISNPHPALRAIVGATDIARFDVTTA